MTIEHTGDKDTSITPKPFSFREYLGILLPPEREMTEEEKAELKANPNKPLSFREYLGALLPD